MQTDDFMAQLMAVAGQTDMAPYVSLQDQRQMLMPLFPASQKIVGQKLEGFLTRKSLNIAESRTLAAIRDALLPKLLSGEIRVKDAKRFMETAS
jgi:type I restriction enzyme S subunit